MFRKKRPVAPHFRVPPPYNPLTGTYQPLQQQPSLARMATMRVKEIHDDYLVCEGWDPDNHAYYNEHLVAKPMALRAHPVESIEFPDGSEKETGEAILDQIDPPYFVGELIVAGKMVGITGGAVGVPVVDSEGKLLGPEDQALPDGMPMEGMAVDAGVPGKSGTLGDGYPIYWIDLNVAGRTWGSGLQPLELKDDLTPGGTATAYRLQDDGSNGLERIDTDPPNEDWQEDEVSDTLLGTTRGKGADDEASPEALRGTVVLVQKYGEQLRIVNAQPWPLMIRGKLTDDLDTTDSTFKIDGVVVLQPVGAIDVGHIVDGSDEVTVHNVFKWEGDDEGAVMAVWNEEDTRWEAVQVECP